MIVLGIDPGVSTGWAIVYADSQLAGYGTVGQDGLKDTLRDVIDLAKKNKHEIQVVVEEFPLQASGKLAQALREVVATVNQVLVEARLTPSRVLPGQWKTSAIGLAPVIEEVQDATVRLTPHERDAIRMARYHLARSRP